ncbi:SLC13 family permease [Temperatibacter marinus]|uniref:SLC13 family permease n=1 Tax=Temperatibacter marinus TaxID=1456591 RepID=A0AA52HA88_9PROT|nr:SLC13 family permease [Temperatibacter marinus]WND02480.1 SLC13 family permease [Temperatibacter marinus]
MEIIEPTIQMWLTFGVVIGAIVAYSVDRIPLEISSIAAVSALLLLFHLAPVQDASGTTLVGTRDLLKGFADPALMTILCLLVTGQALVQTGALNGLAQKLLGWGQKNPSGIIIICLIAVMVVSAVMNNTPVVVIFIPILTVITDKLGRSSSSVMMPLSFVAILGGNLTVIGSSTNLLASGAYELSGGEKIGFFDFTIPGSVMAVVGITYILFIMPRILKPRSNLASRIQDRSGKQFLFQIDITAGSKLEGQSSVAGLFPGLKDVTIRMITQNGEKLLPPYDDITLHTGDQVMVAATRSVMQNLMNNDPELISHVEEEGMKGDDENGKNAEIIAEVVVAPASRLDGRTLSMANFRGETSCAVMGLQRRSRMIRDHLFNQRLEAGDVLLVMGTRSNIESLRHNIDVILMDWSKTDLPIANRAIHAQIIFGVMVALAATGLLPIAVSAMLGALLMIITGCLNVRQASRAIDRRVFTIVGAALALGTAMQGTGGAEYLATSVVNAMIEAPVWVLLSGFFMLVALLTNVLSNNATAVLFTPIAVSIATKLNMDPMPFLLAVIFGANCSFATPMSYQTNLLVMAPGHYRFTDFLKAGTPLIFIMWITFTFLIPWYYNLY